MFYSGFFIWYKHLNTLLIYTFNIILRKYFIIKIKNLKIINFEYLKLIWTFLAWSWKLIIKTKSDLIFFLIFKNLGFRVGVAPWWNKLVLRKCSRIYIPYLNFIAFIVSETLAFIPTHYGDFALFFGIILFFKSIQNCEKFMLSN